METNYPPLNVPAAPEYVLSVIEDQRRQQSEFGFEDGFEDALTFDSTVAQWFALYDVPPHWRRLGRALNEEWAIRCTDKQWKSVLKPARQRTLRDVCGLIAAHATQPEVRPISLMGKPCRTAGTFLTIRHFLREAGAEVSDIAPSTLLAPYLRRYVNEFLGPISRLAPGTLPVVKIRMASIHRAVGFALILSVLLMLSGFPLGHWLALAGPLLVSTGGLMAILFILLLCITSRFRPASVEFGNLRTFRDISTLLAARSDT